MNILRYLKVTTIIVIGVLYDSKVDSFIHDLYKHGFIFAFDWGSWHDEAKGFFDNPDSIAKADLLTLRRLLTTHVRKDRFCEGHLANVLESGHIVSILRRLKQIRLEQKL